ncbi:(deoxy)nucleoside triphosphate pyrophosphohydrolase [Seleniivibrio sp.]|uniref:(deoxy)nucleoside triphosphate pyrophosphohydrolase n=1 Tax=Seleniivibrio sp. TaxID=2898801 RepID=UPI0025F76CD4|nr:(deoxy)nucleoside triphosphate pyrophosphohydrolase [Seleniivibrio sp.]MCD8554439.1 (deoxy)nucleoside triphosphate pyrophosphohydrolase [Seleniivibrio sp.]
MKEIDVVAAVLNKDGKYFIARRPLDRQLGGLWEFPGGKVESGETHEEALVREMLEEFDADVKVCRFIQTIQKVAHERKIILHFYHSELISTRFEMKEHIDMFWGTVDELKTKELAPGDYEILDYL